MYVILRIYTSGEEIKEDHKGSPFVNYRTSSWNKWLIFFQAFGTYWLIIVLNNFNDFVCAAITVNNYFQTDQVKKIGNLNILCHCLGHHVGSVAWSIVLLPTLLVKFVFGIFDYLLTGGDDDQNGCQRFFDKLCMPCCKCYEIFIDRFSECYFGLCYMGSENFYKATTRFYYLSEKYHDLSSTMFIMGGFFGFVGKAFVSLIATFCAYIIYEHNSTLQ